MAPKKNFAPCMVVGCERRAIGRGYCNIHYQLWRRYGAPMAPSYEDRLRARLLKKTIVDDATGCWLWDGRKAHYGHGVIVVHGKHTMAHRVSWELHNGPIPPGAMICHTCDVPACVNPAHLYAGSAQTNSRDMVERGRSARGERSGVAKLTEAQVIAIRADSRTRAEIAGDYAITATMVNHIKSGTAWSYLETPIVAAAPGGKLTREQADEIRRATGRQVDIAEEYGVSQVMVSKIKRGAAWAEPS